jgi:hypothetical protein
MKKISKAFALSALAGVVTLSGCASVRRNEIGAEFVLNKAHYTVVSLDKRELSGEDEFLYYSVKKQDKSEAKVIVVCDTLDTNAVRWGIKCALQP